jgi:adenylylsulfate kinase
VIHSSSQFETIELLSTLQQCGLTVWCTGLSGAGKTTICQAVYQKLIEQGLKVEHLDGDLVRQTLTKGLGFSQVDREENIRRIGAVAHFLTRNQVIVLVSAISPYQAARQEARQRIGAFLEVFVQAPLAVCEQRDVKGLYQRVRAGEIQQFTGIDAPYEPPLNPEVICSTAEETIEQSVAKVMQAISDRLV